MLGYNNLSSVKLNTISEPVIRKERVDNLRNRNNY